MGSVTARAIKIPLAREPELLLGLKLSELVWVALGTVWNVAVWRARWVLDDRVGAMAGGSLVAALLVWMRYEDRPMWEWIGYALGFVFSTKRYLP